MLTNVLEKTEIKKKVVQNKVKFPKSKIVGVCYTKGGLDCLHVPVVEIGGVTRGVCFERETDVYRNYEKRGFKYI